MGIFRRKPRRDGPEEPRDPDFTFFSEAEGALFRTEVRNAFAERGVEVTVPSAVVRDDSGRQFGLGNIAAVCHNDDRGQAAWPGLIHRHVDIMLRGLQAPEPNDLPPEDFRARLYPRVLTESSSAEIFDYGRVLAPGLREGLALDYPDRVALLPRQTLDKYGTLPELTAQALDNLRQLSHLEYDHIEREDGGDIDVVMGESLYTTSFVLLLDELTEKLTGRALSPDGALVVLPHRHQLAFHPIRDQNVVPALNTLARFAVAGHMDSVGPLSPCVYWWRAGQLTQLSSVEDDELRVTVGEEFQAVLERVVG
ncbi:hypothetical protein [Streptomyces boninensis]|uniref:hypothetical protein n=1 Tax=Streptomyces boninensis TaxID=2039455 RepID=UPI003B21BBF1